MKSKSALDNLTQRAAEGHQAKGVANLPHIGIKTVEKHRSTMIKLDLHDPAILTASAFQCGLIGPKR